jgi:CheY-like chemotaxis protein
MESPPTRPLVVVLDDDWDICEAMTVVLEDAGYAVACLPNGADGIEYLNRSPPPAVILLDLMMPVMDGWSFYDRVRSLPHLDTVPVIVVTAIGPHWGYPVARVLRKPIDRHELLTAIREAMNGDGQADAAASAPLEPDSTDTRSRELNGLRDEIRDQISRVGLSTHSIVALRAALRLLDAVDEHKDAALHDDAVRVATEALELTRVERRPGRAT